MVMEMTRYKLPKTTVGQLEPLCRFTEDTRLEITEVF